MTVPSKADKFASFLTSYGTYNITSTSLDDFLTKNENAIVFFYVPWCSHCTNLFEETAKLVGMLEIQQIQAKIALFNAAFDKESCERYNIRLFPTLLLQTDGKLMKYQGKQNINKIINWIQSKLNINLELINDYKTIEKRILESSPSPFVLAILPSDEHIYAKYEFISIKSTYQQFDDISFAYSTSSSIANHFNVNAPSLLLFHLNLSNYLHYVFPNNLLNETQIKEFIQVHMYQPVIKFTSETTHSLFNDGRPILFILLQNNTQNDLIYNSLLEVAEYFRDSLLVTIADGVDKPIENRVMDFLNIPPPKSPTVYYIKNVKSQPIKYRSTYPLDFSGLKLFIQNVRNKRIQPDLKSAPIPNSQPGPIYELVSSTYEHIVLNTRKDVLVYFYTNWCDHCNIFQPVYTQVATDLMLEANILIAQIDASVNDLDIEGLNGFPTLFFYPSSNKSSPIIYDGTLSYSALINFLHLHTSVDIINDEL